MLKRYTAIRIRFKKNNLPLEVDNVSELLLEISEICDYSTYYNSEDKDYVYIDIEVEPFEDNCLYVTRGLSEEEFTRNKYLLERIDSNISIEDIMYVDYYKE